MSTDLLRSTEGGEMKSSREEEEVIMTPQLVVVVMVLTGDAQSLNLKIDGIFPWESFPLSVS